MRCLFCGKRLALLRKLTDGEFCSSAHRERYIEEGQKLALARLIESEQRGAKSKTPRREASAPAGNNQVQEVASFRAEELSAKSKAFSPAAWPQPLAASLRACLIERPERAGGTARSLQAFENALVSFQPGIRAATSRRGIADNSDFSLPASFQPREVVRAASPGVVAPRPCDLAPVGLRELADSAKIKFHRPKVSVFLKLARPDPPPSTALVCARPGAGAGLLSTSLETVEAVVPAVVAAAVPMSFGRIPVEIQPSPKELRTTGMPVDAACGEDLIEASGRLAPAVRWWPYALFRAGLSDSREAGSNEWATAHPQRAVPTPARPSRKAGICVPSLSGARLARFEQAASDCESELRTGSQNENFSIPAELPLSSALPVPAVVLGSQGEAPTAELSPATMALAARSATPNAIQSVPAAQVPSSLTPFGTVSVPCPPAEESRLPEPAPVITGEPLAAATTPLEPGAVEPEWALSPPYQAPAPAEAKSQLALRWPLEPRRPPHEARKSASPVDLTREPMTPKVRLETVFGEESDESSPDPERSGRKARVWMAAAGFWNTAPADLKWLALALPAVLLVVLFSAVGSRPTKPIQAAQSNGTPRSSYLQSVVRDKWVEVRRNIASRAAINLQDDFRSGLAEWEGPGNWAKDWQYDPAGFILTGPLAMYRPSRDLTDYRFEFLGQIDKKSLNWVFRAADYKNYYAMKIVLLKSGPLPKAAIMRYAVIDGKQDKAVQLALPIAVRSDSFFRVRVEVRGQNFTTAVQDQVVDFWSDGRLSKGGVGFFSEKGERARLRWVEVSHQHDTLGRLCAFLAPYNIQSGDGSLNRQ